MFRVNNKDTRTTPVASAGWVAIINEKISRGTKFAP